MAFKFIISTMSIGYAYSTYQHYYAYANLYTCYDIDYAY